MSAFFAIANTSFEKSHRPNAITYELSTLKF